MARYLPDITKSCHGMLCISIKDPSKALQWFIKRALRANHREDPFYVKRQKAHPFLQADAKDYILVEFWTEDKLAVQLYLDWLESVFERETMRTLQMFGEYPI